MSGPTLTDAERDAVEALRDELALANATEDVWVECQVEDAIATLDAIDRLAARQADADTGRAKVITLCGSTKFKDAFHAENQRLTMAGHLVISLGVFGHTDLPDYDWTTDASDLKRTLDGLHFQKIRMADEVHVVDPGGYVGESTAREIAYAESLGKPVTYMSGGGGRVAEESENHWVSPGSTDHAGSRERLDPLAATTPDCGADAES